MTKNLTCSSGRSVPTSGPSLCSRSRQAQCADPFVGIYQAIRQRLQARTGAGQEDVSAPQPFTMSRAVAHSITRPYSALSALPATSTTSTLPRPATRVPASSGTRRMPFGLGQDSRARTRGSGSRASPLTASRSTSPRYITFVACLFTQTLSFCRSAYSPFKIPFPLKKDCVPEESGELTQGQFDVQFQLGTRTKTWTISYVPFRFLHLICSFLTIDLRLWVLPGWALRRPSS